MSLTKDTVFLITIDNPTELSYSWIVELVIIMELKIFNGTNHEINLYKVEDTIEIENGRKLVKKAGATPFLTIPAGTVLNCRKDTKDSPFPSVSYVKGAVEFVSYDPYPKGFDAVIVSNLYRSAVKELGGNTKCLAVIDGAVYEDETAIRPCGCLNLAVG